MVPGGEKAGKGPLDNRMDGVKVYYRKVRFFVLLPVAGVFGLAVRAEDASALRAELEKVQRQLAELQGASPWHSPERWQQRHRAEYEQPGVKEVRERIVALDKAILEKRTALRERLAVLFPELREQLRQRDEAYAALQALETKARLVGGELRLAERKDPPDEGQVKGLRAEQEQLAGQIAAARNEAEAARQNLLDQQREKAGSDAQCAALQSELEPLETQRLQLVGEMNGKIDALPESAEQEAARRARLDQVLRLKQCETELKKALTDLEPNH